MLTSERPMMSALIVRGIGYLVGFFAYSFLTGMVLFTFGALMTAYIILIGTEMPFLPYISFMLPLDESGSGSLNGSDIMRVYNSITMVFFVLSIIGRKVRQAIKPANQRDAQTSIASMMLLRPLLINGIVITGIFMIAFVAIPFANLGEGTTLLSMYSLFLLFYVLAMIANGFYVVINAISNMILQTAPPLR